MRITTVLVRFTIKGQPKGKFMTFILYGTLSCQNRQNYDMQKKKNSQQLCLVTWKNLLFVRINDRLVSSCLDLVTRERNSEPVDTFQIKLVVQSLGFISKLIFV